MCGILGYFSREESISEQVFSDSLARIRHRGPDNTSVSTYSSGMMGHARLAIIDLDTCSNQPFSADDRFHIVFNGEIYNYQDIRKELSTRYEEKFKTSSDTEVLLRAYIRMGPDVLRRINGMYAFAIYDSHLNTIFAARDRVGKKPFYYSFDRSFIFASELKAMLPLIGRKPALSSHAIHEFLSIGYIIAPRTIYENIYKLEPGHYLTLDIKSAKLQKVCYWDPVEQQNPASSNRIRDIIQDAVDIRYNSDVPVGIMLSGGLDSNIVAALSKDRKPTTFTIRTDQSDYDESALAAQAARHYGCENLMKTVHPDPAVLEKIVYHYDEPMADSSAIPSLLLSGFIKEKGFSCVLNGDGADEIFGGYDRYKFLLIYEKFRLIRHFIPSFRSIRYKSLLYNLHHLKRLLNEDTLIEAYAEQQIINRAFEGPLLQGLDYKKEIVDRLRSIPVEGLNRFIIHDFKYYLPDDLLVKMDRATMAYGVESRSPFLDYRLAEIMLLQDFSTKTTITKNKLLLRELYAAILPQQILKKKKSGFQIPIDHWFLNELKDEVTRLKTSRIVRDGYVDQHYVADLVDQHLGLKANNKFQIYILLIFERWYRIWASE